MTVNYAEQYAREFTNAYTVVLIQVDCGVQKIQININQLMQKNK